MNDRTRLPLPINTYADWNVGPLYTAYQMHAYSDAECAPLVEEIEALRQDGSKMATDNAALRERVKVLEDALRDAADDIEEWGSYASDYFIKKWDLAGDVARARAALGDKT